MRAFVIIATKGRTKETLVLLNYLQQQTLLPTFTLIVGTSKEDIEGCEQHLLITQKTGLAIISPHIGASSQRNYGIKTLRQLGYLDDDKGSSFCAFFDDDFRPAEDWLLNAAKRFAQGDIVGLTGRILADGVMTGGLSEEQALAYLNGGLSPQSHWANQTQEHSVDCAYGCNMAFSDVVIRQCQFDENLPLYSWQEDYDYTGQALAFGRIVRTPDCCGVHMGVSSGRTSGLRFGYSQVANPLYLMKKGTMPTKAALRQVARNFIANIVKSIHPPRPDVDYPGRLRGNLWACCDLVRHKMTPRRILDPDFRRAL